MRKLIVFNHVTLDGYFVGENGDMGWAHKGNDDPEWSAYVAENAKVGGVLLFGRVTYDMMASYWPTPDAAKNNPEIAEHMNNLEKVVFSRTMDKAKWENTELVKGDLAAEVQKMKQEEGKDMVVMGSGTIVAQLAHENLVDEFQVIVNPLVLGKGRTMFEGVRKNIALKLVSSRAFGNGKVLLCYEPVTKGSGS